MTWLEPEIMDRFCQGQQSLHHNSGIYNGQWSDMFIETNWMRKGHGPGGISGMTESPQMMATWVYSMDAIMTLTGDLRKMSGDDENVLTTPPTKRSLQVASAAMGLIDNHHEQLWSHV